MFIKIWRRRPDSNRGEGFAGLLPYHFGHVAILVSCIYKELIGFNQLI